MIQSFQSEENFSLSQDATEMMTNDNSVIMRSFWSDGLIGAASTLWLTERESGREGGIEGEVGVWQMCLDIKQDDEKSSTLSSYTWLLCLFVR